MDDHRRGRYDTRRRGAARDGQGQGRHPEVVPGQAEIRQAVVQRGKVPEINVAIGAHDDQTAAVALFRLPRSCFARPIDWVLCARELRHALPSLMRRKPLYLNPSRTPLNTNLTPYSRRWVVSRKIFKSY